MKSREKKINSKVAEECLAGVPAGAGEEAGSVWRVPLRINRNTRHFEVRLGPPGGDKVGPSDDTTTNLHEVQSWRIY